MESPKTKRARLDGKPHLVLHFDVNKTIIISDPVSGMTTDKMVNSLLSEVAWGTLVAGSWQIDTTLPDNPTTEEPRDSVCYPRPDYTHLTFSDYVEHVQKLPRAERKAAKGSFTELGEPGETLRVAHYDRLMAALRPPPKAVEAITKPEVCVPAALQSGDYFLLPSFLALLGHLDQAFAQSEFTLVFRTFGIDLPEVAEELNLFYAGRHPYHPFFGVRRDLRLPEASGCFQRSAGGACSLAHVDGKSRLVRVIAGFGEIFSHIESRDSPNVLGLQDCYPWWAAQGESDDSGKLTAADMSLLGWRTRKDGDVSGKFHHIFFDDNIERDRAHIVDCRDRATGEPVAFDVALDKFIVKSEPLHAITDREYFIKALHKCIGNVANYNATQ